MKFTIIQILAVFHWIGECAAHGIDFPSKTASVGISFSESGHSDRDTSSSPSTNQLVYWSETHVNNTICKAQTAHGIDYPSLTASLAIGVRGPVLLQDVFLLEKIQSFNRERIPERVVHAKGVGAFGYFVVTHDITQYTKAKFLQRIGQQTKVAVRFSTAGGESGSADTSIDHKGFSIKFYTEQGIYDLVGINLPVFGVRDPMLFMDLNRANKRNPQTHLIDPNMVWDFASLRPEIATFQMILFSDMGIPQSYRFIDGAGVHTFKMVNNSAHPVYVKLHWKTNQAKKYFTPEEAVTVAGENPDFLTKDLFDSIEKRVYPSWTFYIQVMTFEQAAKHPYNPFDVTKFWRIEDYPLIPFGKMVLNRNPKDYFTEVEQLAFSPSRMVPGIEPSPDRFLHSRLFAYLDSQLYRLGANFAQIPVNHCPFHVHTYQRDGSMNVGDNGKGGPNYYPNSFNGLNPASKASSQLKFSVCGDVDRVDTGDEDNFSMAKLYYEHYVNADERKRIIHNFATFLGPADLSVQKRYLNNVAYNISKEFGSRLKKALKI